MPEISRFFGIIIAMFYDDHNPPHFHARYGNYKAAVKIDDFTVLQGELPQERLALSLNGPRCIRKNLYKIGMRHEINIP